MIHRPPPLALLHTFEVAARHLSFKQAAAELHVSPAAISQQIKALEAWLGEPLFLRLTRALQLSERGAAMLPAVQQGLACLDGALRGVRPLGDDSVLLLTAPPSFATHWLIPRLPDFYRHHPGIEVRLSSSSATVDPAGDGPVLAGLARAAGSRHCALAILFGTGDYGRFSADRLMTPQYLPVCAPGLATAGQPLRQPADLRHHVLLHDDTLGAVGAIGASGAPADKPAKPGLAGAEHRAAWGWPQWLAAAGVAPGVVSRGRHFSNAVLAVEASLAGQGVALAARDMVAAPLAAGTLVAPFELAITAPCSYFLVLNQQDKPREAATALRHWLQTQAQA